MKTNEKEIDALNNLIVINNDRIEGYRRAAEETDQADLKILFNKYSTQSARFASELKMRVTVLGGEPSTGTTNSGKIYRAWMDVKAALTGKDRKAILNSCEYGEDVALGTYKEEIKNEDLGTESRSIVNNQLREIQAAHDEIKQLRDGVEA
jgi:uncharacterized protein (TIGR02284 family)